MRFVHGEDTFCFTKKICRKLKLDAPWFVSGDDFRHAEKCHLKTGFSPEVFRQNSGTKVPDEKMSCFRHG
jgi:hypothetical protein